MNLRICIPIHVGGVSTVEGVLNDINTQDLSSCKDLHLETVIIANGNAPKEIEPGIFDKYSFPVYYQYFPLIKNAGQARNAGLTKITDKQPDAIMYHDYDDTFYSKRSLSVLVNDYFENRAIITFGDSFIINKIPNKLSIASVDYSKLEKTALIDNIVETLYFPFQSSLLDYQSCIKVGGIPEIETLEDRIFIINLLYRNSFSINKPVYKYINNYITNYIRHEGTLTELNTNTSTRKRIINALRKWNESKKGNLYEEIMRC